MPKEEVVYTPPVVISPPEPPPVIAEPPVSPVPPPVTRYEKHLKCEDDTRIVFNSCGLDILPFLRPVFADIDQDGIRDLVAGSKDGAIRLYKKEGTDERPVWRLVEHYFDGIEAGAFSAPAVGDIDNDGRPEVLVGTGGFSPDSGRVLVYRNIGTPAGPAWKMIEGLNISVGNDATPALFDVDGDGRPDLIVGNSTGGLVLYRNKSDSRGAAFRKDTAFFNGTNAGMYAAPAVASSGNKTLMVVGDSMGRLLLFEKSGKGDPKWSRSRLNINVPNFASPTFVTGEGPGRADLVVSDGDGQMYYFRNKKGDFRKWEELPEYFSGRIFAGPACTPSVSYNSGGRFMVTGNIGGGIKLFEYVQGPAKIPWKEKKDFFSGIRLSSFSRGVLTEWDGKDLLITGQQDGLRAFTNKGDRDKTSWTEMKDFFQGTGRIMHAAPAVYDLEGDGSWELVVGDAEGRVRGFRQRRGDGDMHPQWEEIIGPFRDIKVDGYASPSVFSEGGALYILVGQQDGRLVVFSAGTGHDGQYVFRRHHYLSDIKVDNHSSPSVVAGDGRVDLSVGDYNGSLRHFACRSVDVEIGQDRVEKY
ncbi:MAG: VCBS repeat-containing protein [Nitrospirae bacterium]|nr:VCBS repeat-containing protein [Nitrospirota bacterium]